MRFRVVAISCKMLVSLAFVSASATLAAAQSATSAPTVAPAPVAIGPGDAAISGFSGAGLAHGTLAPGVNPLDKTVITLSNPSLKILDVSSIGGEAVGQLLPPNVKFAVPAKDIGQVFGLAFDARGAGQPPDIYAAATSLYGLSIVAEKPGPDGTPVRLKAGAPGARFMEGQFGPGATPGAIWKIDGTTGKASLFAETVQGSAANSGPALGDIAVDLKSKSLFASDLDTGMIHRFPLEGGGTMQATFDHGTTARPAAQLPAVTDDKKRADIASPAFNPTDPKTWGLTQAERRVDGLAVRDGRLYYAVAAGPEVWSVGISADGSFAGDPRRELEIKAEKPALVSDIAFDADGRMIVALRGVPKGATDYRQFVEPAAGAVLRFSPKTGDGKARWTIPAETYAVGTASPTNMATGGIALSYAYAADGTLDLGKCSATLAATGDALPSVGTPVNGAQLMSSDLVQPAKAPEKSAFVDFDALQNDKALTGHVGDIEIFQPCDGTQFQTVAGDPGAASGSEVGAAPGGFGPGGRGGGGFGGGGLPGEALPEEGIPEQGAAEAPVDPNAPNMAQQCQAAEPGKPVTVDEAAADGLSVKNVAEPTCTPNPDGKTQKCRFPVAFENKTDKAQQQFIKFRTEPPAQGPMNSETPAQGSGIRGDGVFFMGSEELEPGQTGTPVVFAGDYLLGQQPVGQPSVDRAPRVRRVGPPTCDPPQGGEQVCRQPLTFENPSQLANPKLEIMSNNEPKRVTINNGDQIMSPTGSRNVGATISTFDTSFAAGSKADLVATVVLPEGAGTSFIAQINSESLAAAEKLDQDRADAATAAAQQADTAAATGDGQSCVASNDPTAPPGGPGGSSAPPGGSPPAPSGPITVSKRAVGQCSPIDGNCEFEVTVKNNTNQDIPGEISINEVAETQAGDKLIPATFGAPPNAPWSCSGSKDITCTHPGPLRGNGTEILRVTMKAFGNEGKQNGVTNCAQLSDGDPDTGNQDLAGLLRPISITENGLAMAAAPQTATCSASAECVWDVTLTNNGTQPLTGPLRLSSRVDTMLSAKPSVTVSRVVAGEGLVCPNTPGKPEDCSSPNVTLAPGESRTFSMGVTASVPGDSPSSVLRSTFSANIGPDDKRSSRVVANVLLDTPILGPDNKLPDGTPSPEEIAALPTTSFACATALSPKPVAAAPPPPATDPPDLVVTKLTPGEKDENGLATCDVNGKCRYQIAVTNKGGTYKGPLTIEDRITPPPRNDSKPQSISIVAGDNATDRRLNCAPPTDFSVSCTAPEIEIKQGEFVNVIVEVALGASWKNVDSALVENCGLISLADKPTNNGIDGSPNHRSCKIVKLDPFDVKVAKTGGQSCQPGKDCKFNLDIFNPGNIPHDDPVTVTDKLTGIGNAQIVSLTAGSGADPFPCSPPPTQAPFTCTGHMRLEVGEHNTYQVVIRIPEDAPKSGTFTNCAGVGESAATATPGGTDDVCHTTKLEPPAPDQCPDGWTGTHPHCDPPQISGGPNSTVQDPVQTALPTGGTNPTAGNPCFGGMILVSAGECRCPAPTVLNGSTGTCVAAPECPEGYEGDYPYCQLPTTLTGGPNMTGGSNSIDSSQDRKDRRTSTSDSRRGGGGPRTTERTVPDSRRGGGGPTSTNPRPPLTGGTNNAIDGPSGTKMCNGMRVPLSFNCPPRRIGKPTPKPQPQPSTTTSNRDALRLPDTPRPPLTGGRNNAVQGPTEGKFPSSGPPRAIGKVKNPAPCPAGMVGTPPNCHKPPRAIGKVKNPAPCPAGLGGTPPNCRMPPRAIGKVKKPEPRINYGSSSNDNKPPPQITK